MRAGALGVAVGALLLRSPSASDETKRPRRVRRSAMPEKRGILFIAVTERWTG